MPLTKRLDFIKEMLVEEESEDADGNEIAVLNSARSRAINFLNALESVLVSRAVLDSNIFPHFFKVREVLRMPGSSTKMLMESVALVVPDFNGMQSR